MEKILFIVNDLEYGGAVKSVIELLKVLDPKKYEVSLFSFEAGGPSEKLIPEYVNVIPEKKEYLQLYKILKHSWNTLRGNHEYKVMSLKLLERMKARRLSQKRDLGSNVGIWGWEILRDKVPTIEGEYDVVLGNCGLSNFLTADKEKVKAKKRIGWIHMDYEKAGFVREEDYPCFEALDSIVCVSDDNADVAKRIFPEFTDKIIVLENLVSVDMIEEKADAKRPKEFEDDKINLVTVSRLVDFKAIDRAAYVAARLKKEGYKFNWMILGEGCDRPKIEQIIETMEIGDCFKLLGYTENPYPYIKHADLFVLPSHYEGKSIALDEAKVLNKAILTTNYPSAKDSIDNGVNGMICDNTEDGIFEALKLLFDNEKQREAYIKKLTENPLDQSDIIEAFYKMLEV